VTVLFALLVLNVIQTVLLQLKNSMWSCIRLTQR